MTHRVLIRLRAGMSNAATSVAPFIVIFGLFVSTRATAQQPVQATGGAGDVLRQAIGRFSTVPGSAVDSAGGNVAGLIQQLVASDLAIWPSSSPGFTWSFDRQAKPARKRVDGSIFVDSPITSGRGHVDIRLSYQATTFKSIDGVNLSNGDLFAYREGFPSYVDVFQYLTLTSSTTVVGMSVGVSDRVDVAVLVPFATMRVSGHVERHGSGGQPSSLALSGRSSGVGDMVIRGKANLVNGHAVQLAIAGDLRLPTGDADQLLGVGRAQPRAAVLVSTGGDRASVHASAGFLYGGPGIRFSTVTTSLGDPGYTVTTPAVAIAPSNVLDAAAGADWRVSRRVTVSADFLQQVVFDTAHLAAVGAATPSQITYGTGGWTSLVPATDWLRLGVAGLAVSVADGWLLHANVMFPLSDTGLKPGATPVVSVGRTF